MLHPALGYWQMGLVGDIAGATAARQVGEGVFLAILRAGTIGAHLAMVMCGYTDFVLLKLSAVYSRTTSSGSIGPAIEMRHLLRHRIEHVRTLDIGCITFIRDTFLITNILQQCPHKNPKISGSSATGINSHNPIIKRRG